MRVEADSPESCSVPAADAGVGCILRTPVSLTGGMVSLLRTYFGSTQRACLEKATFLWSPDDGSSGVYISDEFNWDLKSVGIRPALIVSLEDFSVTDQAATLGRKGVSGQDLETGAFNISSKDIGGFSIQCIAKSKLECWSLAWEVRVFIQSYAHEIGKAYRYSDISVSGIRKPVPLEGSVGYLVAVVGIPFKVVSTFQIVKESLPATTFDLNVEES